MAALALTAVAVYVGLRAAGPDQPVATPRTTSPSATPMARLDLSGLPVRRASLCGRIARSDVEAALRGPVAETSRYDSGDRASIAPGVRDVAHEFDCTYQAASGAQARVWVFAERVTRGEAADIARAAKRAPRCRTLTDGPTFGTPDAATVCRVAKRRSRAVTLSGLFGDAWLSCRLSSPAAAGDSRSQTVQRAQRWCVRVATSVGARP